MSYKNCFIVTIIVILSVVTYLLLECSSRRKHRGKSDVNVLCGDREAVLNGKKMK